MSKLKKQTFLFLRFIFVNWERQIKPFFHTQGYKEIYKMLPYITYKCTQNKSTKYLLFVILCYFWMATWKIIVCVKENIFFFFIGINITTYLQQEITSTRERESLIEYKGRLYISIFLLFYFYFYRFKWRPTPQATPHSTVT